MKKISCFFLFLLVFSAYAEKKKLPVISKAEELKTVKGKQIIWKKDGAEMVYIPSNPDGTKNDFYIDAYEVTIGQFKTFLKSSGYKPDQPIIWNKVYEYSPTDKHPMINIDWHDATAYAKWAGKRLPTQKEWEFAAGGGLIDKEYSWGNDVSLARDYANYRGVGGRDKWDRITAPVGSLQPNGYGLYDMAGNVWEWCQDSYDSDQKRKVLRGGSWDIFPPTLRLAARSTFNPNNRISDHGFRCVSGSN